MQVLKDTATLAVLILLALTVRIDIDGAPLEIDLNCRDADRSPFRFGPGNLEGDRRDIRERGTVSTLRQPESMAAGSSRNIQSVSSRGRKEIPEAGEHR